MQFFLLWKYYYYNKFHNKIKHGAFQYEYTDNVLYYGLL